MQGLAQENLKKESKTHSSTKVCLMSKSTIRHFWSANRHFQSAEWNPFELWPNSLQVPIRHILFDLFAERGVLICILLVISYFLSIPASINRDVISKFNTLFYALRETLSHTPIFLKLGFLGFKDNCINFFEP